MAKARTKKTLACDSIPGTAGDSGPTQHIEQPDQQEIAALAYALWTARGCPEGSAEDDWYGAERELLGSRTNGNSGQAAEAHSSSQSA